MLLTAGSEGNCAITPSTQRFDPSQRAMSPVPSSMKSEAVAALVKEEEPHGDISSITSRLSLMVDRPFDLTESSSVSLASDSESTCDSELIFAKDEDCLVGSYQLCGLDAQRYDPTQRGSQSPGRSLSADSSISDLVVVPKKPAAVEVVEASRADPMDPQRYDLSKRSSPFPEVAFAGSSLYESFKDDVDSFKHCKRPSTPNTGSLSESSKDGADSLKNGARLYTLNTNATTNYSSFDADDELLSSPSSSKASVRNGSLVSEDAEPWTARRPGTDLQLTDQWQNGDTVTTRVIIRPGPSGFLSSHFGRSGTTSPPPPRPKSPLSPNLFRSLNCKGSGDAFDVEEQVGQTLARREQQKQGEGVTIFVHEQRRCYTPSDEEREQFWRDAKCNLYFGGDREAFEKQYPPGCSRWD